HKWGIIPRLRDGVYIFSYEMEPEYWTTPGDMTIGVFCHMLGHSIGGLPDLYDIDGGSQGIGRWSLMAGGSWNGSLGSSPAHFDAWCKIRLGFAVPYVISSNRFGVQIPNAEQSSAGIFRLWNNGALGPEYYLVENRQRVGYDAALPSSGLLIWHIDDTVSSGNRREWYPPNPPSSGHYQVALVQADNLFQLEKNQNSGNSGDPFPGSTVNRNFNSLTAPNSASYTGESTFVKVENISASKDTMTADLGVLAGGFCSTVKGDMNADSGLTAADVMLLLNCVFLQAGSCDFCFTDVNCDGVLRPADVVLELFAVLAALPFPC
ncbi:MAG: M6 family metalloprotease domain-containing protein, partial [Limisphaerales bacterium]